MPNVRSMIWDMMRLTGFRTRLTELIGGGTRLIRFITGRVMSISPNYDSGVGDYSYYDRARKGKVRGLEISGLLIKPLGSKIASWAFGKSPKIKAGNKKATTKINEWWQAHASKITSAYEESLNLADMYIVVNPDLSLTVLPPNVVSPIVNPANFSEIIGWRTEITYQHPTQPGKTQTIVNEYYADRRVWGISENGSEPVTTTYRNFIKRIPVVHIPNNQGTDEMFGHPEWEALVPMLQKYGAVFSASIEGNIRQGRATPVISKMGSATAVENFWNRFGRTRQVPQPDGTNLTEYYLDFDGDKMLTLGEDAQFDYKAPPSSSADTSVLLGLMFYLLVEHGEIPEGFLGSAIQGSKASLDTQMEPLVKFIQKKQSYAEGWVLELVKIVLRLMAVIDSTISVEDASIKWAELTNKDGKLVLSAVELGRKEGVLDRETTLRQLPLEIDDVQQVLDKAEREAEEERTKFGQDAEQRILEAERRAAAADADAETDTDAEDADEKEAERQARPKVA